MVNNTLLQTFFMAFKNTIMVIFCIPPSTTKPLELMLKKFFLPYIMMLLLPMLLSSMIKKLYACKSLLYTVKINQFSIMLKN